VVHLRIGAAIRCSDGPGGELTQIIADRATRRVTHIVVERKGLGKDERLVPVEQIVEGSTKQLVLLCSVAELATMPPRTEISYDLQDADLYYSMGSYPMGSYPMSRSGPYIPAYEEDNLPENARPVQQGMRVVAQDGPVGRVYELLVDTTTKVITHLVLVDGHLWRKRAITLPLSAAQRVTDETIYLKLDKREVGALPSETLAELDRTALEDQLADVTARLARLEADLPTGSPDDRTLLQHDIERLQRLQHGLRAQLDEPA
jgi:sporulation protein YlmC with PRC-barrel domain